MSIKPEIEFPCHNYPIKIVALNEPNILEDITDLLEQHASCRYSKNDTRLSKQSAYISFTFYITATGPEQLSLINQTLRQRAAVKTVL